MESFSKYIGTNSTDILKTRVTNTVKTAEVQSRMLIENLKMEYTNLQSDIENMLDLGITNSMDLGTNLKNLDTQDLFKKLYEKADKMSVLARQINIRINIHNSLFPTGKIENLTKEELDFLNGLV
jgi:hypothetical protein